MGWGLEPHCSWETSHYAEFAAVLVAFKASDVPIPPPPILSAPVSATVKATASVLTAFGVVGPILLALPPSVVRVLPGLMAGAEPGSLAAPASVVKVTAGSAQKVFDVAGGFVPLVKATCGILTLKWVYLSPNAPYAALVRCRALLPWIQGGDPVGAGSEWHKPLYGGTVGSHGGGTGDTCTCYNQPFNRRKPGDLLILGVSWVGGTGSVPAPVGWTLIATDGSAAARVALYWKRHGPTEPSQFTIYGLGSATIASSSWIETYRGGYLGNPVLTVTTNCGPRRRFPQRGSTSPRIGFRTTPCSRSQCRSHTVSLSVLWPVTAAISRIRGSIRGDLGPLKGTCPRPLT